MEKDAIQRMRLLRWSKGLSMGECAAALGIGIREFVVKEHGRQPFSQREIACLANLLDATPKMLIDHLSASSTPPATPSRAPRGS